MTYDDESRTVSTNILREYFRDRLTIKQQRDEARLFYVATTRAKYSLHMVAVESKLKCVKLPEVDAKRCIDFIPADFDREVTETKSFVKELSKKKVKEVVVGKKDKEDIEKVKSNLDFIYPNQADTTLLLKTSVTANLNKEDKSADHVKEDLDSSENYIVKFSPTAEEGTLVHKVMENYNFIGAVDFDSEIARLLNDGIVTKEELSLVDLSGVKKVISSPLFEMIAKCKLYKEQYFVCKAPAKDVIEGSLSNEKVLLQGVIDLLVIDGDDAYIVDYKYSSKGRDALIKTYAKQLKLYKYAVETSLNIKVKKTYLVSLLSGEIVETD